MGRRILVYNLVTQKANDFDFLFFFFIGIFFLLLNAYFKACGSERLNSWSNPSKGKDMLLCRCFSLTLLEGAYKTILQDNPTRFDEQLKRQWGDNPTRFDEQLKILPRITALKRRRTHFRWQSNWAPVGSTGMKVRTPKELHTEARTCTNLKKQDCCLPQKIRIFSLDTSWVTSQLSGNLLITFSIYIRYFHFLCKDTCMIHRKQVISASWEQRTKSVRR